MKSLAFFVFVVAVFAGAPSISLAQSSATGSVVDSRGKPVVGAAVKVRVTGKTDSVAKTVTNKDGEFTFQRTATTTYEIVVKETGYDPGWMSSLCHQKKQDIHIVLYKTGEPRAIAAVHEYLQIRERILLTAATVKNAGLRQEYLKQELDEKESLKITSLPSATDDPPELAREMLRARVELFNRTVESISPK